MNDKVTNFNDKKINKERAEYGSQKKKRNRLTLATPEQVRRYMQGILLQAENDEISESKARLLLNGAESILKAILQKQSEDKMAELEMRLEELEEGEL